MSYIRRKYIIQMSYMGFTSSYYGFDLDFIHILHGSYTGFQPEVINTNFNGKLEVKTTLN